MTLNHYSKVIKKLITFWDKSFLSLFIIPINFSSDAFIIDPISCKIKASLKNGNVPLLIKPYIVCVTYVLIWLTSRGDSTLYMDRSSLFNSVRDFSSTPIKEQRLSQKFSKHV